LEQLEGIDTTRIFYPALMLVNEHETSDETHEHKISNLAKVGRWVGSWVGR
jgi:hypothetical protein